MSSLPLGRIKEKSRKIIESDGIIFNRNIDFECKVSFRIEFDTLYPESIDGRVSVLGNKGYSNKELSLLISGEPFWINYETYYGIKAIYIKPNYAVESVLRNTIQISINHIYLVSREEIKGVQKHNYLDFESDSQHGSILHYMKPFKLQGTFFEPTLHFKRGIVLNYDYDWKKEFEEGEWVDDKWVINLGNKITINPTMSFLEQEYFDVNAYTALPEVSFQANFEHLDMGISDQDLITFFEEKFVGQDIIEKAISFTTAKRIYSHFSIMSYFWPLKKVYLEVKRYKSTINRKTLRSNRTQLYNGGWELIRDISEKVISISEEKKQRVFRSINRYVESFEAPFLEIKLVLLHSALSILLDQKKYTKMGLKEVDVPSEIPIKNFANTGALPKTVVAFMIKNHIKWSDLSKNPESENLNEFNELRNQYLKQLDHKIRDIRPINTLCTIFERVLLYELGLKPTDYPVIE